MRRESLFFGILTLVASAFLTGCSDAFLPFLTTTASGTIPTPVAVPPEASGAISTSVGVIRERNR